MSDMQYTLALEKNQMYRKLNNYNYTHTHTHTCIYSPDDHRMHAMEPILSNQSPLGKKQNKTNKQTNKPNKTDIKCLGFLWCLHK